VPGFKINPAILPAPASTFTGSNPSVKNASAMRCCSERPGAVTIPTLYERWLLASSTVAASIPQSPPSNAAASFGLALTHLPVSSSLPKIAFKTSPRRSAKAADDK